MTDDEKRTKVLPHDPLTGDGSGECDTEPSYENGGPA